MSLDWATSQLRIQQVAVCRCRRIQEDILADRNAGNGGGVAVQRRRTD